MTAQKSTNSIWCSFVAPSYSLTVRNKVDFSSPFRAKILILVVFPNYCHEIHFELAVTSYLVLAVKNQLHAQIY